MSESEEVVSEPVESEHVSVETPEVIPTVVVGKKKKIPQAQALPEALPEALPPAEQLEEPIREKPKPKRASRARAKAPPPPPPEPVPEPITAPKKSVRIKKAAPIETTSADVEEPVSSRRLLSDLNDFSTRIQELHRMNEQHRKNVYRELIGGMI